MPEPCSRRTVTLELGKRTPAMGILDVLHADDVTDAGARTGKRATEPSRDGPLSRTFFGSNAVSWNP